MHSKVEPAPQFFKRLNGFKALLGLLGGRPRGWRQEVRISLMVASTHTTAQLMKLCESQLVSTLHDNRVGGRHVNPRFDNRRAKEQVVALLIELTHDVFEFSFAHLTVCNGNTRFRNQGR